jgi:AAA family ATP:ADP antiporter
MTAGTAFVLFKAFDYSLFRAAKEILYIPLSFDERYRAKEFIDVFGYRCSKGGISLFAALGQRLGLIVEATYGALALMASALWVVLAWRLVKSLDSVRKAR